jgi:AcrR family transcriptional regulator
MGDVRRRAQHERLEELVAAGAVVFARHGYRRAQMADVARQAGVSPGNLYNYVDSKDALFYLVLRRVFGERAEDQPLPLPVTGATVAMTAGWVADRLDFTTDFPLLERALARRRAADGRADTEAVVGELFDVLSRVRLGVDMIERSVDDLPQLAAVFGRVRQELFSRYERYVRTRSTVADAAMVARLVVELCSWAADRRHHDPHTADITDATARQAVCAFVASALAGPTTEEMT